MSDPTPSRREFLHSSGAVLGGAWLAAYLPELEAAAAWGRRAVAESLPLAILTPEEARELGAIADRIVPSDELGPGAVEAGVVHFVDRLLEGPVFGPLIGPVRGAVAAVSAAARERHAGVEAFSSLDPAQQDAILTDFQGEGWFGAVRFLTVSGMFSDPSLGGNREEAGWRLVGFVAAGAYQPPFGHYDAEAMGAPPPGTDASGDAAAGRHRGGHR